MEKFIIEGGHTLSGTVVPSGNKNAAFPLISAALLTDEPVTLRNLPDIGDVRTMLDIVADLGIEITRHDAHSATLRASDTLKTAPDPHLFGQIRGALVLMGSMLARQGHLALPRPGGDQIGRRPIDTHLLALQALGAQVDHDGQLLLSARRLRGADILLDVASVTGTENAVLAAVTASGTSIIHNVASEPHVQDLCHMLNRMGARIEGIGSNVLTIHGVDRLHGTEYTLEADHIEVGSLIGLAAATGSQVLIKDASPHHLRMIQRVYRRLGVCAEIRGDDVFVPAGQSLTVVSDLGGAIPEIDDGPWPVFPADMMSIAIVVATQASGTVLFHEKVFESRLFFVDKLINMGARIVLCDPHRAVVVGPSRLHGEEVTSPDIRAGMAMIIAALCAQGRSTIHNIRQIDRGYEGIEDKLRALGAHIERVDN
ncbi:MAG: UDP-N-acetylglucosamine 1-carboxyvinyltransferase [Chloroflexota bacterium]